jgi:putative transposase
MAPLARTVVPGVPHHVNARGNRREPIFFEDGNHEYYGDLLGGRLRQARVSLWADCLMPTCVHLVACPERTEERGAQAVGQLRRGARSLARISDRGFGEIL